MKMSMSLCTNCESSANCTLKNGHAVSQCEEYALEKSKERPLLIATPENLKAAPGSLEHFKGLCGNCEYEVNCSWRKEGTIVFQCEHYV